MATPTHELNGGQRPEYPLMDRDKIQIIDVFFGAAPRSSESEQSHGGLDGHCHELIKLSSCSHSN